MILLCGLKECRHHDFMTNECTAPGAVFMDDIYATTCDNCTDLPPCHAPVRDLPEYQAEYWKRVKGNERTYSRAWAPFQKRRAYGKRLEINGLVVYVSDVNLPPEKFWWLKNSACPINVTEERSGLLCPLHALYDDKLLENIKATIADLVPVAELPEVVEE